MKMTRPCAVLVAAGMLIACTGGTDSTSTPPDATTDASAPPDASATTDDSAPAQPVESALEFTDARQQAADAPDDAPDGTTDVLSLSLKEGIEWSDGTPLVAKDFEGGYDMLWTFGDPIWDSLLDVVADDETTLTFYLNQTSPNTLRTLLRSNQTGSRSQFGDLYDRARKARLGGEVPDGDVVGAILGDLDALTPEEQVSYGPFAVDPDAITTSELRLVKNDGGFAADEVPFEDVTIFWGGSQQSLPLLLAGDLDYSTDAFTDSDVAAVQAAQPDVEFVRSPLAVGPALWFNGSVAGLDSAGFRRAVAHAVDRDRVAQISLGAAGEPVVTMAGFPDDLVADWLSDDVVDQLDPYTYDVEMAASMLTDAGYTESEGSWSGPSGDPIAFEITAPSDFPDFLAAARDVSEQLNDFGFETTVRSIPSAQRPDTIAQADYEALIDFGMISTPAHPESSFSYYMTEGFFGSNNPDAEDEATGLNWPLTQEDPDGDGEVDVRELLAASTEGTDMDAQRAAVETLAQVFNDELPVIPLFERYTTDPINTGARVTGWLPLDDPLYDNNQGSDNYVAIQILSGQLELAEGSDGSFRTNVPYTQPPDASLSFFAPNSLQQSFNSPTYHLTFPPLFWYYEAGGFYTSQGSIAESYSLTEL